jgi:hypothetical protein
MNERESGAGSKRVRINSSAAARMASHRWACPDCAWDYGCRTGSRGCETCGPPRNPLPARRWWDDEE